MEKRQITLMHNIFEKIVFIVVLFAYVSICVFTIKNSYRREGIVSTALIFVISSTLYYIAIPVELYIMKLDGYSSSVMYVELLDMDKFYLIFNGALTIIAFLVGYRMSGFSLKPESFLTLKKNLGLERHVPFEVSIYALLMLSVCTLLVFYRTELSTSMSGYESNYNNVYNNPTYSYLIYVFMVSLSITTFFKLCLYNKVAFGSIMICVGILLGVLTSDKNPILIALLPLMAKTSVFLENKRYGVIISLVVVFFGIMAVLILIPAFSLYRAGFNVFNLDILDYYSFSFTKIDPSGPFISLADGLNERASPSLGVQYFKNIAILFPKSVWPNRPLDLGEQFARDFIQQWEPGRGLGYSLMTEGFVNFGRYFCFLHYLIVGLFWGLCWRVFACIINNQFFVDATYRTLGFYLIILMPRGSSLSIIKPMLHFLTPLVVLIAVVGIFKPILRTVLSDNKPHNAS